LESRAVSLDQDGDGLLVEDGLDSADGVGGDHLVALGLDAKSSSVESAASIFAGVGIRVLSRDGGGLVVIEGFVLPSSIASVVHGGAIDELLLSEGEKGTSFHEVSAFHSHVGGEGPARSARALVLDSVDSSLGSPVDAVGGGRAGAGTTARSTGLFAVGGHEGVGVSRAPSLLGPGVALAIKISAGRSRGSGVALATRFLAVGDHVSGVSGALATLCP